MRRVFVLLTSLVVLATGCDAVMEPKAQKQSAGSAPAQTESAKRVYRESSTLGESDTSAAHALWKDEIAFQQPAGQMGPGQAPPAPVPGAPAVPPAPAKPETPTRKIIRTGNVELVVPDLDAAALRLQKLVEEHKGFIGHSDVRGTKGERRTATWTIRIPVDEYDAAMDALPKLGEMLSKRVDSQDVSDEYYDIEARLKNKQVEEKRLLEHLQKSTGKLEDILAVEKELSRVREEIERFQGRLNKLANLTSLTAITVSMQEIKDYVPQGSPTFGTSISRTFGGSTGALGSFLQNVVLFVVAIIPWLPLAAVIIGVPWWLVRRRIRSVPVVSPAAPAGNQS